MSDFTNLDLRTVNASERDDSLHVASLPTTAVSESLFNMLLNEIISYVRALPSTTTSESQASLIESIGYSVGLRLSSILLLSDTSTNLTTSSKSAKQPLQTLPIPGGINLDPSNSLSVVKYLCKDFWSSIFGHQITKLQTNHRGVFVLKDDNFPMTKEFTVSGVGEGGSTNKEERTRVMTILTLSYPCGLIRGALKGFGRESVVSCDFLNDGERVESTSFNVKILMH